jgi:hypothetical protein
MSRWLFLPDSVFRDLDTLSRLKDEDIRSLAEVLDSDKLDNMYSVYVDMAERLKVSDQEAASLYSFWDYIQREKQENGKSASDVVDAIIGFLSSESAAADEQKKTDRQRIADRIRERREAVESLFGDFPRREQARKAHELETGPLPHISSLKAYCDLRPVFDQSGNEITAWSPIITLRVAIHDTLDDHKEFFVQLSERNISMLEDELGRLRRKLDAMKSQAPYSSAVTAHNKDKRRRIRGG